MAKEILVTDRLTDNMTHSAAHLIAQLDKNDAQIKSAFWFFYPDKKMWRLILASPLVSMEGPKLFYKRILNATEELGDDELLSLHDITASTMSNKIVQIIKSAVATKNNDIADIRYSKNSVNGTFIEDSLIYRSSL